MLNNRTNRQVCFAVLLITSVVFLCVFQYVDRQLCMGVRVVDASELKQYQEGVSLDFNDLSFCGEAVPADTEHKTIYLTQPSAGLDHHSDLRGTLTTTNADQVLYFIRNEAINDPRTAMRNGEPLSLAVIENGYYCTIQVVITSLPVLRIYGSETENVSKNDWPISAGIITMFSCEEGARDYVVPQTYHADWFVRGQTSAHQSKKPWKLSFKDKNGDKKNISVGEMGEDDDWILNPMNMEDTKIREKLAMDIWNQDIADSSGGYRMSTADYVEVVMNEEYQGLYLMQRRIDEKYLKLNKEDILLKARTTYTWTLLEEAYEIVYSPFDSEKTYEILQDVLVKNSFDVDSLMNTSLFLEFFCMVDNAADKNMCYVLKSTSQGYKMYWVPWDTDISLGLWYNDGFVYDYETTMHSAVRREEYYSVQEKEEQIDEWYMGLWNELRDTVYTSEKIIHRIISLQERIENSGAFQRDQSLNGTKYGGRDTHQELIRWCEERVETFYQ